jgi:nucleotide-binding universal stress UspA family protein
MKRRILIATDFSKNAQNAINYAINLYQNDNCDFYFLNTFTTEAFTMELAGVRDLAETRQNSIAGLSIILDKLAVEATAENHRYHTISEYGVLIDIMKSMVDKHDIDIVIMGTKGNADPSAKVFGSQTVLAMEKIRNCPVLAIPAAATYQGIKEIVFPTGYKTPYKRREFQYLVDIAKKTGAAIRVVHVSGKEERLNPDQRNRQRLLKDYFEGLEYSFHLLQGRDVQSAIDAFIKEKACDMVAFINKKHNFINWLLSKPMVKKLTYHATIPVLALHDLRN